MDPKTDAEKAAIRAACTKFLSFETPRSAADWVAAMAASKALTLGLDAYSAGPAITALEERVAGLLGKPAALWFPKGIIAQQAALLVHAQAAGRRTVALHPKSHLALDEAGALERLAGLTALRVGADHRHFTQDDLDTLAEPLAAVTLELPLRRAGFLGLPFEELAAISGWARARGVAFHLDAARLWEVQPWLGRGFDEIAALADSVYVSLYKGLGGLAGSVLAGSKELIAAARPWRLRFGGDLPKAFPLIITALDGLDHTLPLMGDYYRHACAIAAAIEATPGLRVFPSAPHGNSFQVHFEAPAAALQDATLRIAAETGTWLFGWFAPGQFADRAMGEIVVGSASMGWAPTEVAAALATLQERARSGGV
jgi:threonine aldolase